MMMIVAVSNLFKVAVVSSAAYLGSQCARNMIQTIDVVQKTNSKTKMSSLPLPSPAALPALQDKVGVDDVDNDKNRSAAEVEIVPTEIDDDVQAVVVNYLSSLTKRQLLELFCRCEPPPLTTTTPGATTTTTQTQMMMDIVGQWDGFLLHNNGLTTISNIITHQFFSIGCGENGPLSSLQRRRGRRQRLQRRWTGKQFSSSLSPSSSEGDGNAPRLGTNRFRRYYNTDDYDSVIETGASQRDIVTTQHQFDYLIEPSRIQRGTKSLITRYHRYQTLSFISPWYTMKDELRVVPNHVLLEILQKARGDVGGAAAASTRSCPVDVLLGMGSMAWSGGALNSAPFCLIKSK